MIAAFALILSAGAATACPGAAPARLAGGAMLVRPVGRAGPLPFEQLGPATGIPRLDAVHRTGAASNGEESNAEATPDICAAAANQIA